MTSLSPADRPLRPWESAGVAVFLLLALAFGALAIYRSAAASARMTDFGVYARAAWTVRQGGDPYEAVDDRGWHYAYPPPFVLAVTPLADPPAGADRTGYLPFAVSVGVWYAANLLFIALAAHLFALAALPDARPASRRWWYARLLPLTVCLGGVGFTLARGQVNVLVLALLAAGWLLSVRRRPLLAGALLAAAACVKVIPGVLVLAPILRRRWLELAGFAGGTAVLLFAVPAAVWGPGGAVEMNERFAREVMFPGVTNRGSTARERELTGTTSTDSQAFQSVAHALRHPDPGTRPMNSDGWSKAVHYLLGLAMLGVTAWAFLRGRGQGRGREMLLFGGLCVVMTHLAPVSHMHYYAFSLPLVAGLAADDLARHPDRAVPSPRVLGGLAGWAVLTTVPLLDPWPLTQGMREFGLAVAANVGLWAWAVARLAVPKANGSAAEAGGVPPAS